MARIASTLWRWARAAAVGGMLLLPAALPAQATHDDRQREAPEVKKLVLKGVKGVSSGELQGSIATQASACKSLLLQMFFCWYSHAPVFFERHYLDRTELRKDVVRIRVFYWKRGWRDVVVDTAVTPNGEGVTVTFDVTEGPPTLIARLEVQYDSTLLRERIVKRLTKVRAGEPLDLFELDSTRALLQSELWNKGYADAVVDTTTVVDTARHVADLTLRLVPNWLTTVGPITVRGNEKVARSTIANSLTLRTGNPFRRDDILVSQRNLYESNLFRQAQVTAQPVPSPVKPIEIVVSEAPQREARWSSGFNTVEFIQLEGRFTHHNLFGGGRRLDVTGVVGNLLAPALNGKPPFRDVVSGVDNADVYLQPNWQGSVDFKQPAWLQRPQNQLGFGVFAHRRSFPGVFIDHGYGGSVTLTRMIRNRAPLSANYRYEITRVEASDVYFCVNYGVCDQATLAALRQNQRLSPLGLGIISDLSDDPFNPTHGWNSRLDLEHASAATGSSFRYNRLFGDGAIYKRLSERRITGPFAKVFAAHLRFGLVRPLGSQFIDFLGDNEVQAQVIHPRKRFYAGGSNSVRGYGESQLGPRLLTVAPEVLARTGCDTTTIASIRRCNPNAPSITDQGISNDDFTPRPLGGTGLLEGSVEYRFPLWKNFSGAVFVDAGIVTGDPLPGDTTFTGLVTALSHWTGAITPGFGVRYRSPVGPIRVDLGINPSLAEELPVATEVNINGSGTIVPLPQTRLYSPSLGRSGVAAILSRLVLHLSIGQAF